MQRNDVQLDYCLMNSRAVHAPCLTPCRWPTCYFLVIEDFKIVIFQMIYTSEKE